MSEKQDKIITQSEAAKIAGVSRQALSGMFKKDNSSFRFFTLDGKVDTSLPDWKSYLDSRTDSRGRGPAKLTTTDGTNSDKKKPQTTARDKRGEGERKDSAVPHASGWDREHALTGGYDPAQFVPTNTAQLKALTDIVARNLEVRIKLGDLIPREMVDQYLDRISQGVNQFVTLGRSVSTDICEKLDRVGMEKEVEKMINPKIKVIIEQIIESCNNAKK